MPNFEYDKDYPFAAFITNLGKYNEGDLVGEWVKFPTTYDEMQKVFERIGIGQKDDFGYTYEEWFITDYDCYVPGLYDKLGEYENLDELNYLASKLDEMNSWEYDQFCGAMEVGDHSGSLQEIINLTENLDCYDVYPDINDYDDLGRYYIDELDAMQVPEHLKNYIDYEAYGRDIALDEGGEFTEYGYVRDTGDRFVEVYDGDRENIPEEYRVMSNPEEQELTEDQPDDHLTGETVQTPRGSFHLTDMTVEQMQAAGYGIHHSSDDMKFHIMGNGTRAFAVINPDMQEKDNPLRTAEMTIEDDYGMIDGIINNGRRGEEMENAKPSIRERLEDAKRECAEHKPPEKGQPTRNTPEHGEI